MCRFIPILLRIVAEERKPFVLNIYLQFLSINQTLNSDLWPPRLFHSLYLQPIYASKCLHTLQLRVSQFIQFFILICFTIAFFLFPATLVYGMKCFQKVIIARSKWILQIFFHFGNFCFGPSEWVTLSQFAELIKSRFNLIISTNCFRENVCHNFRSNLN